MSYKIIIVNAPLDSIHQYIDAEIGFEAVNINTKWSPDNYQNEYHLTLNSIFLAKKTAAKFKTKWQKVDEGKGA